MSEFKFACPVCGQRMAVDSSATGAQVECPTCFQIVIVPKAPVAGSKYQLSATQYLKPVILPPAPSTRGASPVVHQRQSAVLIFALILACAAATALFVREKLVESRPGQLERVDPHVVPAAASPLWTLNLTNAAFPETTAAGRIHGKDFVCRRAVFQNGLLVLRSSTSREPEMSASIFISTNTAEAVSGRSFAMMPDQLNPESQVSLFWREGNMRIVAVFTNGFALKLDFGSVSNNLLPGRIYLCLPDEAKSFIAGTFTAGIRNAPPRFSP